MKKHKFIYILFCIAVWSLSGCIKGESDYSVKTLNEVTITTGAEIYSVTQTETLTIVPQITESIPSGASYSYEWKVSPVNPTNDNPPILLSEERDLDMPINLTPGNYYLRYYVTDTGSGLQVIEQYRLNVTGRFYEGWLVASNKGQQGMLSFLRADDALTLNAPEELNDKPYPGNAKGVYNGVMTGLPQVIYFSDQGMFTFDANNFMELGTTVTQFGRDFNFGTRPYYGFSNSTLDLYVIDDGSLYAATGPYWGVNFGDIYGGASTFSERVDGSYTLFPYAISPFPGAGNSNPTFFYDNENKRFMLSNYNSRIIGPATGNNTNPGGYNLVTPTGKTMIGVDYTANSTYFCVLKDDQGVYVYTLTPNVSPFAGIVHTVANSPDIENATSFATSSLYSHLYYAAENKIYLYDLLANSSRLVYTLPAGYQVKDLKMHKRAAHDPASVNDPMFNRRLVAAVDTPTTGEGELYYFTLETSGNIENNTFSNKFTGFGEIVNISYRTR